MAYATRGFPYSGSMTFRNYVAHSHYDAMRDCIVIDYMGAQQYFDAYYAHNNSNLFMQDVSAWLDLTFQSPPSYQKGQSNVSRQSPQDAASGAPVAASPGAGLGTNHLANINQQQLLQQQAIAQQTAYTIIASGGGGGGSGGNAIGSSGGVGYASYALDEGVPCKPERLAVGGTVLGEIIGWRGWKVRPNGLLRSMTADVLWAPGEPMEGKVKAGEEHCGIFAYKVGRDFLKKHADGLDVYGKVAMWGRVIEHELGYRSEFAKITELTGLLNTKHGFTIHELRANYGV